MATCHPSPRWPSEVRSRTGACSPCESARNTWFRNIRQWSQTASRTLTPYYTRGRSPPPRSSGDFWALWAHSFPGAHWSHVISIFAVPQPHFWGFWGWGTAGLVFPRENPELAETHICARFGPFLPSFRPFWPVFAIFGPGVIFPVLQPGLGRTFIFAHFGLF